MKVPNRLKSILLKTTDRAFALVPRSSASVAQAASARVIAHRGAWDHERKENTIAAFEHAISSGAWGLEFDIRWTKDERPVVLHDVDAKRVFGLDTVLSECRFEEWRKHVPLAPALEELLALNAQRAHLMIELKGKAADYNVNRWLTLSGLLAGLEPVRDYHLMALDPELLLACPFVPREALLPVAEFNFAVLSELALKEKMAGVTGPYALVGSAAVRRHLDAGQKVGTGFVSSPSVLWRESKRGVEWLFTNQAPLVSALLAKRLAAARD